MKRTAAIICCLLWTGLWAQIPDVQHYQFALELSDRSDTIKGTARIRFKAIESGSRFQFDLAGVRKGKGMQVQRVELGGKPTPFTHEGDLLLVNVTEPVAAGGQQDLTIQYAGIPADGLIISRNKYGDRTFFSDNWPNRARHWIPCNDRPDDKASVEFEVTAPVHYQVVSNGLQTEETNMGALLKKTVWKESTPIPTKVMVIGAARFAVGFVDTAMGVPVSAWVYPQDRDKGFHDYALAGQILRWLSDYIGPYPFQKLANVQSKTIFGGMENASAIFYSETSVTGDRSSEGLIAHEVAHQWFGNMATEKSFAHLWLSEGFATYLTNLYMEAQHGARWLQDRLREEREQVIGFATRSNAPVVNETSDLMTLLNANSYQKGGWVLHMLRSRVGDAVFRRIVQTYYAEYKGGNADTRDFQQVAQAVSGLDLEDFFQQWLYQSGVPHLNVAWKYSRGQVHFTVQQIGEQLYQLPLELALVDGSGKQVLHRVEVSKIRETYTLPSPVKPAVLLLDPNVNLLFAATVREER